MEFFLSNSAQIKKYCTKLPILTDKYNFGISVLRVQLSSDLQTIDMSIGKFEFKWPSAKFLLGLQFNNLFEIIKELTSP